MNVVIYKIEKINIEVGKHTRCVRILRNPLTSEIKVFTNRQPEPDYVFPDEEIYQIQRFSKEKGYAGSLPDFYAINRDAEKHIKEFVEAYYNTSTASGFGKGFIEGKRVAEMEFDKITKKYYTRLKLHVDTSKWWERLFKKSEWWKRLFYATLWFKENSSIKI